MELDLTEFWNQLFYPLNNIISIAFIVFITLLSEKLVNEMEKADILEVIRFNNSFLNKLFSFIFRFTFSFGIVLTVIYLIVLIISIILASLGVSIQLLFN